MASTQPLTATATLSSGNTQDVTSETSWVSDNEAVATVSAAGIVTAVAVGSATVTGTYQGLTGTCAVTVSDPVEGLAVTPANAALDLSA